MWVVCVVCTKACWADDFGWEFADDKAADAVGWWPCEYADCALNKLEIHGVCVGYKDGEIPINTWDS